MAHRGKAGNFKMQSHVETERKEHRKISDGFFLKD
jgi:hypothetical protein